MAQVRFVMRDAIGRDLLTLTEKWTMDFDEPVDLLLLDGDLPAQPPKPIL